jgi:hypothetical protein
MLFEKVCTGIEKQWMAGGRKDETPGEYSSPGMVPDDRLLLMNHGHPST